MCFDFIMQHELQRRPCDLVMIDNEHAPLIDSFGSFNTDLHCVLARVSWGRIHLCG
jgi:hypothetical protein